jgi:citrate synthase
LTGELPNHQEFEDFSAELKTRSELPKGTLEFIQSLPQNMHPMTQLSSAILNLQPNSQFAKAYARGIPKNQYWEYVYEDALELLAKVPALAAYIYRHTYRNNEFIAPNTSLDWAGNFSNMLGYDSFHMRECLRGYLAIHRYFLM